MRIRRFGMLATASVTVLTCTTIEAQSVASSPDPTAEMSLEEIVVTARRKEEGLQEVPLVVNALTSGTIENLNLRRFDDIAAVIPGLRLEAGNAIGASTSLRGVKHDTLASGANGTVAFYVDDAPVSSDVVYQAMFDIGQIEVLRGPQGTLRGKATPSGSITLTTRHPDLSEFGGYAMATYASGSSYNVNGAFNAPIIRDVLAVRVAGIKTDGEGDRIDSFNSSIDPSSETEGVRASIRFQPIDALGMGFSYQRMRTDDIRFQQVQSFSLLDPTFSASPGARNYGVIEPSDRTAISIRPDTLNKDIDLYNWNVELAQFGQKLIYVGSRHVMDVHSTGNQDYNNFFPSLSVFQHTRTQVNQLSHELRLQNEERVFGLFDYVLGYFDVDGDANVDVINDLVLPFGPGSVLAVPIDIPTSPTTERSFYGNLTAHIGEATEVSAGARRIKYTQDINGVFVNGTLQANTLDVTDVETTIYSATAKHRFNDSIMLYTSYGTSWRPPNLQIGNFTVAPLSPLEREHAFALAEESKSYEMGVKTNWLNNRLTLNASYFYQDFDNYPLRPNAGIYYVSFTNAGGAVVPQRGQFGFVSSVPVEVNGVETEIGFRVTDNLNLFATTAWTKSEIQDAMVACTDALNNSTGAVGSDGIQDTRAPTLAELQAAYGSEHMAECPAGGQGASFQPEWSGSVQADYSIPINANFEAYLRGLVTWRGDSDNDPNNRFDEVDAYALLNLYVGVRHPDGLWEATVFAKNVTDETKIVTRNDTAYQTSTLFGALNGNYSRVNVTPEREIGLTVKFAFGSR